MSASISTLFEANAVILLVFALAFFSAWRGQRSAIYWTSWLLANLVLATALILFMAAPLQGDRAVMALANCLLVAGFGLRWRAARQFGGRRAPLLSIAGPTAFAVALFLLPGLGPAKVFMAVNVVLTAQTAAIAWDFWRDRGDGLPSRYGLVLAYAAISASFAVRVGQGMAGGFTSYLPHDALLQGHLLVGLFHTVASGAFALSIAYERRTAELSQAALCDPLTGLGNRRAFEMRLRECLATEGGGFAVALFDIDHFKGVNDRFGHAAGDDALRACAETLLRNVRATDLVARIGGEEFAIILPGVGADGALELTENIRRAMQARRIAGPGGGFAITLSAGIAHSSGGARTLDALLRCADEGLYQAKAGGRNRVGLSAA